jgi:hypothetical protein
VGQLTRLKDPFRGGCDGLDLNLFVAETAVVLQLPLLNFTPRMTFGN